MKIVFLLTGRTTEEYIIKGIEDYSARIRKFSAFEINALRDLKNTGSMPPAVQKEKEGERILQFISPGDYVVLLDERGIQFRSIELAGWLAERLMTTAKRIVFVAGGPWGFSDGVKGRADTSLSLSRLTFSHQLVRLLFLEQLYRAFTIIRGVPYHHE